MRLAILADIHGNADALKAALGGVAREGADALCVAGDMVGYYYHPAGVLDLLAPWKKFVVRGNHEDMLKRAITTPGYLETCTKRYGQGLSIALSALSASQLDYLNDLPSFLNLDFDGVRIHLAHGAPWDTDQYIYPDAPEQVWHDLASKEADFVVLGHTHYRLVRRSGRTVILNPGSVGQPRDGKQGAAWALIDTVSRETTLFAEPYDMEKVKAEAKRMDPLLPYLHEIFDRK
jgi:putative phosphoesterase